MTGDDTWNLLGFVVSSEYRKVVVESLDDSPKTPSTIAEQGDVEITHVSRALSELGERDIVELLVPESRKKGRIYGLTDHGTELSDEYRKQMATDGGEKQ